MSRQVHMETLTESVSTLRDSVESMATGYATLQAAQEKTIEVALQNMVEVPLHECGATMHEVQTCIKQCLADVQDLMQKEVQGLKVSLAVAWASENQALKDFIQQELQDLKVSQASEFSGQTKSMQASLKDLLSKMDGSSWPPAFSTGIAIGDEDTKLQDTDANVDAIFEAAIVEDTEELKQWTQFVLDVKGTDAHNVYRKSLNAMLRQTGFWHELFERHNMLHLLRQKSPTNWLCDIVDHSAFSIFQGMLILANTCIMIYETDLEVKLELQPSRGKVPKWLELCSRIFNVIFAVELLLRLVAKKSWFFVEPHEWGWNMFDMILVVVCLTFDFVAKTKLSFIRSVRMVRVFRAARVIRVLRFFRELRTMLYSILACLASLTWAFVLLLASMALFTLICLQGVVQALREEDLSGEQVILHTGDQLRDEINTYFSSFASSMFSLVVATTGGMDWLVIMEPLHYAGIVYSAMFVAYVLFVIVGVMNVLTGVFLNSASEFLDVDLVAQNQQVQVEKFCAQLVSIFLAMDYKYKGKIDENYSGKIDWSAFQEAIIHTDLLAFLGSIGIEPTHMRLMFDLLDTDESGEIELEEFVLSMVKLKGNAKAIDARIIQREIGMLPALIKKLFDRRNHHRQKRSFAVRSRTEPSILSLGSHSQAN